MPEQPTRLSKWYKDHVRPLLERVDPRRKESADAECARLEAVEKDFSEEVPVCFLGESGIGKSTLINSLVGDDLVPHGGIGPLTAQALSVRWGKTAAFEVRYHKPGRVGRLSFALEKTYLAELRKQGQAPKRAASEDVLKLPTDDDEAGDVIGDTDQGDESQAERNREFRKQAVLMIAGRQDAEREVPYLIDRLREAVGKKATFGTPCLAEDAPRVRQLAEALMQGTKEQTVRHLEKSTDFRERLREHATGFIAPIIRELVVEWNADVLKSGLALIDLPGVGISGDVHAKVTEKFIRERAKVVVLVVGVRGVTQPDADLLRSSGFLNRLLHAADDPDADPVRLMVVVVRVDDIADTLYASDRNRKKREHFASVCAEAQQQRTAELRRCLEEAWRTDETLSAAKQEVLERIMAQLEVHPLSAIQHRRLLAADEDDPAFIKDAEESNVPRFLRSLVEMATALNKQRHQRRDKARGLFFSSLTTTLRLIREQWLHEARAAEAAEELRKELDEYLKPYRKEFATRRGEYRAFLRETIPAEIEKLVLKASIEARKGVKRYLNSLADAHWATLRAAVRRGGTYFGARHIRLPHDLALRFEEPIAEVWGKELLALIRKRTKAYAEVCVEMVEEILTWAKDQGARVKTSLLEAQRDQIKADAQQLTSVGKELIDELREEVKNRLLGCIQTPIQRKCERFVQQHHDVGPGVKLRVLNLFDQLAEDTVEAAATPATELLTLRFADVEKEISKVLRSDQDPITNAADAIVDSHEAIQRRSDAQRRKAVIEQLEEIENASPLPWPEIEPDERARKSTAA